MEEQNDIIMMPRIGDLAPDFEAVTTKGKIKFSDFAKDKWIVLFSHPADFTPVCTTEMSGFAERKAEFDALNTELIGLSIDSIHSHLAWVNNVKEKTGVFFNFPIIADIDMKVSKLYGMTGFRIGWTIANRRLTEVMANVQSQITSCPPVSSPCARYTPT